MEKGGLTSALTAAGVTTATRLGWGDELRVGLCGQVRRLWAPRGVKVRQRVQWERKWRYLALVVDGRGGSLTWTWIENMKAESVATAVQNWKDAGLEAVVLDGAWGHRAPETQQIGLRLIQQPPYAPELNPAERVFEALRAEIEGRVYHDIEAKVRAVERGLRALAAEPARVHSLADWAWIRDACAQLPDNMALP